MSREKNTEGESEEINQKANQWEKASKQEGLRVAEAQQIDKHFCFKDCQAVAH